MKKNNFFFITKKEGFKYSQKSKDNNRIHIDSKYGYNSLFGKNICHGTLVILKFLKKIKFNYKQIFYMDLSFQYPFFYDEKIVIKKKKYNNYFEYLLIQNNEEKGKILIQVLNLENHSIEKIYSRKNYLRKINFENRNELEVILNKLSMYVGTIYPGENSLISSIKILNVKNKNNKKKNILSITSKVLKKGFPIINNYLKFNSYRVNFESLIRPEVKESSKLIPSYLKKLVSKLNYNVLIIGGSQGLGKYFFDIFKNNKKMMKVVTYNQNLIKSKSKKIIVKKFNIYRDKKIINNLITKYSPLRIYYFPTEKIYFDDKLSKKIIKNYKKIFIQKPLEILRNNKNKKIHFFYPSTINIELNKNSIYSKIKLEAEEKIRKICNKLKIKYSIYRFPAILSRQSISITNPNPPNLIDHINLNKKIIKILF